MMYHGDSRGARAGAACEAQQHPPAARSATESSSSTIASTNSRGRALTKTSSMPRQAKRCPGACAVRDHATPSSLSVAASAHDGSRAGISSRSRRCRRSSWQGCGSTHPYRGLPWCMRLARVFSSMSASVSSATTRPVVVGLTGSIGMGKSTASAWWHCAAR